MPSVDLTAELGRTIRYANPGPFVYWRWVRAPAA